jgi:A/G-specific adenine glycosylase
MSGMSLTRTQVADFRSVVYDYYLENGRHDMPWRLPEADGHLDPYKILVSELMLQQTQVSRVIPKYHRFLELFPTVQTLADAPLSAVLTAWSGLGYNRRAKFLHQAAKLIVHDFAGNFPRSVEELVKLPGVGRNTAGAVLSYAFNEPAVFFETNVRTVYIHHFFADRTDVSDKDLLPYAEAALDRENPRQWYWALMDYGAYLKQSVGNLNKLSMHYTVQSRFAGSRREVRGRVIRELALRTMAKPELVRLIADERLDTVLEDLETEGLVAHVGGTYKLRD